MAFNFQKLFADNTFTRTQVDKLRQLYAALDEIDDALWDALALKADKATVIGTGTGLTGGGDLSTDRTLALDLGYLNEYLDANLLRNAFKNKIINGDFDFWQRGSVFNPSVAAQYGPDRWTMLRVGSTLVTGKQVYLPATNGDATYYCGNTITAGAGNGDYAALRQRIEDVRTFAGERVTLSWNMVNNGNLPIAVEFVQVFGTSGSATVTGIGSQIVTPLNSSWDNRYSVTVDIPSISGKTVGANSCLEVLFWFDAGSDYAVRAAGLGHQSGTVRLARIQLEKGDAATEFEKLPIGIELLRCQRYYEKSYDVDVTPGTVNTVGTEANFLAGLASAAYRPSFQTRFRVSKRAAPSVTLYSPTTGASGVTRDAVNNVDKATTAFNIGEAGFLAIWNTGQTAQTSYSIVGHWTADAEL
jgi:hypothetical protein